MIRFECPICKSDLSAASPNRGLVTAEMLERAAEAAHEAQRAYRADIYPWSDYPANHHAEMIGYQSAAFAAAGIECEKESG